MICAQPAGTYEQEPAFPVLEEDAFLGAGQQVAHADTLDLVLRRERVRPGRWQCRHESFRRANPTPGAGDTPDIGNTANRLKTPGYDAPARAAVSMCVSTLALSVPVMIG